MSEHVVDALIAVDAPEVSNPISSTGWARVSALDPLSVIRFGEFSSVPVSSTVVDIANLQVGMRVKIRQEGTVLEITAAPDFDPAAAVTERVSEIEPKVETALSNATDALTAAENLVDDVFGPDALASQVQEAWNTAHAAATSVVPEYAVSTSASVPPTSDWSPDTPMRAPGHYTWVRYNTTDGYGVTTTSPPALLTGNDGAAGESAVLVRVDSSNGTMFKNNDVNTVLVVTIYRGSETITTLAQLWAAFGSGAYLEWQWQREGETSFSTISAADPRIIAGGFSLVLTPEDVDTKVVFRCIVNG